jgi:hypothetical protein
MGSEKSQLKARWNIRHRAKLQVEWRAAGVAQVIESSPRKVKEFMPQYCQRRRRRRGRKQEIITRLQGVVAYIYNPRDYGGGD